MILNSPYFGEPVYTYSLKQGIEDGYLAPYKVIRVDLDKDTFGWRPTAGMTDKHGHAIEDRIYTGADMNRKTYTVGYDHFLSKRTDVYAMFMGDKITNQTSGTSFGVGIRHRF